MARGNMAKKSVSPQVQSLQIPNRETLDEFLKEARRVWRSAHPKVKKKAGRPSMERQVFDACDAILLEHGPSKKPLSAKSIGYEFTSKAEWVDAIKTMVYTTHVKKPEETISTHFRSWLLDVDEKLADLPSRILFYAFKINSELNLLVTLEGFECTHLPLYQAKRKNEKIPETVRRVSRAVVKLRPYFTIPQLLELRAGGHSVDEIVAMFDAGHSRADILKTCQPGTITLEKFWRPARR